MQKMALPLGYTKSKITTCQWKTVSLGEVIIFTKKPKNLRFFDYKNIPFIPMEYIPNGYHAALFNQFELRDVSDISSGTYFELGDILLAKITPSFENGKQGIIENLPISFGIATTEVIPIKEIKSVSNKYYLFYFLLKHDIRSMLASKMEGSTGRQRLSIRTLANLEICFPPLSEQHTIAYVLQATQQTIRTRIKELELEREHKATLMQYLFTYGTKNEQTKMSEVGEIPESWDVVRLGNIIQIKYGYRTSIPSTPPPDGVDIISTAEILIDGILNLTKIRTVQIPENLIENYRVHRNDVLFNWRNAQEHVGKCAIVDVDPAKPTIFASFILVLRAKEEIDYRYLYYLLTYFRQKGIFFKLSRRAVNQANFNANELGNLNIPLPPFVEQIKLTEILSALDNKIAALKHEITLHEELFGALLDALMTGRISTLPLVEQLEKGTLSYGQRTPDSTGTTH